MVTTTRASPMAPRHLLAFLSMMIALFSCPSSLPSVLARPVGIKDLQHQYKKSEFIREPSLPMHDDWPLLNGPGRELLQTDSRTYYSGRKSMDGELVSRSLATTVSYDGDVDYTPVANPDPSPVGP